MPGTLSGGPYVLGFDSGQAGAGKRVVTPIDAWPARGVLRLRFIHRKMLKRLSGTGRLDDPLRRIVFTHLTPTPRTACSIAWPVLRVGLVAFDDCRSWPPVAEV